MQKRNAIVESLEMAQQKANEWNAAEGFATLAAIIPAQQDVVFKAYGDLVSLCHSAADVYGQA